MCGRIVIELSPDLAQKVFGQTRVPELPARYSVAPTQPLPVIRAAADGTPMPFAGRWEAWRSSERQVLPSPPSCSRWRSSPGRMRPDAKRNPCLLPVRLRDNQDSR